MRTNFQIQDFREINFEGRLIDLHNNFLFQGFHVDLANTRVTLFWLKSTGEWIMPSELEKVTIMHEGVDYFKVLPASQAMSDADSQTLSEVSFFPSNEREEDRRFMDQNLPGEDDDIIYSFIGNQVIRIGCQEATLLK